ncbi:MAG: BrnA antitoxin family protein [Alphaproteobacteria bacterium]|nr:BrnA antitoxin family protein [Alphaproteobacteria bacterium]
MSKSKIKMPSKAENARINKGIKQDKDSPALTAAEVRRARQAKAVAPALVEAHLRSRGRPKGRSKTVISLSVDTDVAKALRATGAGWQTRVNDLLKSVVQVGAR